MVACLTRVEAQILVWSVDANVSSAGSAKAITEDGDYIYVAGHDRILPSKGEKWRVEKRSKADGSLTGGWSVTYDSNYGDIPYAITTDVSYIYVAGWGNGEWRVEKRRKTDGSLTGGWVVTFDTGNYDIPHAITQDANYVYLTGFDEGLSNIAEWRTEKRNKSDGSLAWAMITYPVAGRHIPFSITSDANYIYAAGHDKVPGNSQWRVEKRNKSDGSMVGGWPITYNPSDSHDIPLSIAQDADYIYIVGSTYVGSLQQWHIEKREKVGFVDIGLRVWDEDLTEPIKIACEPEGSATSPLRIAKDTDGDGTPEVYGIVLIDVEDPPDAMDSGVRVQIQGASGSEIKALRKL